MSLIPRAGSLMVEHMILNHRVISSNLSRSANIWRDGEMVDTISVVLGLEIPVMGIGSIPVLATIYAGLSQYIGDCSCPVQVGLTSSESIQLETMYMSKGQIWVGSIPPMAQSLLIVWKTNQE